MLGVVMVWYVPHLGRGDGDDDDGIEDGQTDNDEDDND